MWNEPMPKWRTARKQYQCQGDGCAKVIAPGERYLDSALRHRTNSPLRYCQECAKPIIARANDYHMFRGRNVRFWPKADIPSCTAHVRFWG
jgi:hypothetical protein